MSPTEDLEPSLARACSRSAVQATCKQKKNEWSTFFPGHQGDQPERMVSVSPKKSTYVTNTKIPAQTQSAALIWLKFFGKSLP